MAMLDRAEAEIEKAAPIRLHELAGPNGSWFNSGQTPRPKIYGLNPDGHADGVVEFDHLDGAYSYCVAFDGEGNKLGVCHLAGFTPLEQHLDGYRIMEES